MEAWVGRRFPPLPRNASSKTSTSDRPPSAETLATSNRRGSSPARSSRAKTRAPRAPRDAVAARAWPVGTEVRVVTAGDAVAPGEPQEKLRAAGLMTSEVTKHGEPVHVLIHEAEEWGADSIFVGNRNVHGLRHLLRGSVACAVAARAQCSVEVVRPARSEA